MMEREVTREELIEFVNQQRDEFVIHVAIAKEANTDAKEE
jgi:hypothetical protein